MENSKKYSSSLITKISFADGNKNIFASLNKISDLNAGGAGGVSLNEAGCEVPGGHAGVRHPHRGQRQVRHVQQRAAGQQVVAPPAVRVLSQEPGLNIF